MTQRAQRAAPGPRRVRDGSGLHDIAVGRIRSSGALRWTRLLIGLWLFAAGIALMLRANLGLSPWDVLHDSVATLTPLSFGQGVIAISIVVLAGSVALGVKPGPGTVANVILVGAFTDVILATNALAGVGDAGYPPRLLILLAGIFSIAIGTALYIGAQLGAGPRDSLMLAVAARAGTTAGTARAAIEVSVLLVGMSLGGTAGMGTIAFAVLIGPAVDVAFRLFGMQAPRTRVHWLIRTGRRIRRWRRSGQLAAQPSPEAPRDTGTHT